MTIQMAARSSVIVVSSSNEKLYLRKINLWCVFCICGMYVCVLFYMKFIHRPQECTDDIQHSSVGIMSPILAKLSTLPLANKSLQRFLIKLLFI